MTATKASKTGRVLAPCGLKTKKRNVGSHVKKCRHEACRRVAQQERLDAEAARQRQRDQDERERQQQQRYDRDRVYARY